MESADANHEIAYPFPELDIKPIDEIACMVVGPSPAMQNVLRLTERVATNGVTVLVTGESGTGKEVIARLIHKLSSGDKPFCAFNCAAITESLIETELFGYEAGAFTGANKTKFGKLEKAEGGTVFLDEIEAASPALQQKILRVIEYKQIERVGGTQTRKVNIRFVAASNKNLKKEVKENRFREDLLYRFTIPINIPPLRERAEDIPNLAHHILIKKVGSHDAAAPIRISAKAMAELEKAPWKGNVRELENVLTQAIFNRCGTGDVLYSSDLIPFIDKDNKIETPEPDSLAEMEKITIERVLQKTNGNKTKAAVLLGITRRTLKMKINLYELENCCETE